MEISILETGKMVKCLEKEFKYINHKDLNMMEIF